MRYDGLLLGVWVVTAIDRTAYPRFTRVVPARELAEAFTPTVDADGLCEDDRYTNCDPYAPPRRRGAPS